jgi:hypothetical protein
LAYIRYRNNPFDFKKGKILGLDDMGKGKKRYLKLKHKKINIRCRNLKINS